MTRMLTSLLVATLLKLMLKPSAFNDSCKSYPFLYNTSKNHSHMVKMQTLGPNFLIFSFSSGVYLHPMLQYYHYVYIHSRQLFLTDEFTNMMSGGSTLIICRCRRVLLDAACAIGRHVCWRCVHHYTYLVHSYVVSILYENRNNGDKFYLRNPCGQLMRN